LNYYLNTVISPNSENELPLFLVGSHSDALKKELGNATDRLKAVGDDLLVQPKATFAVNCTNSESSKKVRKAIKKLLSTPGFLMDHLPASYLKLADLLKQKSIEAPIMPWREFVKLAETCGILSHDSLLNAKDILQHLGYLWHIDVDRGGLKDIVILRCEWLTNVIETLISADHSLSKMGVLTQANLNFVWKDFAQEHHIAYTVALEHCQLLFPLQPRQDDFGEIATAQWWIPLLLPQNFSATNVYWPKKSDARYQYQRDYKMKTLPFGLLSRLMVEYLFEFSPSNVVELTKNGIVVQVEKDSITSLNSSASNTPRESYNFASQIVVSATATLGLVAFERSTMTLSIGVRGSQPLTAFFLLQTLTDKLDCLLEFYYHLPLNCYEKVAVCHHCLLDGITPLATIPMRELEKRASNGKCGEKEREREKKKRKRKEKEKEKENCFNKNKNKI